MNEEHDRSIVCPQLPNRRHFLQAAGTGLLASCVRPLQAASTSPREAQIAITLDLEMSRHYPRRGMMEWDYQKGNLDDATKAYSVKAARVAADAGAKIHYFCVGRVLEQENVDWLKEIAASGHPIGNHTYDHVNVMAKSPADTQFRFQRSPWLIGGRTAAEIIRENIRLTNIALQERAKITADGFRTPGGFYNGLTDREDVQRMLLDLGFKWVSSRYPKHLATADPDESVFADIIRAQPEAQPFVYPTGLIEVPMSPISDVTAFRSFFWKRAEFLRAIREAVEWAIETGSVFDLLCHPSCLVVEDPDCETIRMICDLVRQSGKRARIVGLSEIACACRNERSVGSNTMLVNSRQRLIFAALVLPWGCAASAERVASAEPAQCVDLLIVGATESGWAAAIQAARMGVKSIAVVHDGTWMGGQFTEQALACVDENKGVGEVGWGVDWHPMKRAFHRSGLFKELMDRIEAFNTDKYGSPMPGKPYHGPSTFRPFEAEQIFRGMLQPYVDSGQVRIFWQYYPRAAERESNGRRLQNMRFQSLIGERDLTIRPRFTIDASDWGEAIQVAGADFECGPDPRSRYSEAEAPTGLSEFPANEMNPITWAMIVEESAGDTPVERPQHFDDRNYVRTSRLSLEAMRSLDWDRPVRLGSIPAWPPAGEDATSPRQLTVFNVRRLVDGYKSKTGKTIILLNYMLGQDYPLERLPQRVIDRLEADEVGASQKNIVVMTRRQRNIIFDDAKQHALGVLYHLQNFVHDRSRDTANSFRHFHLSSEFGTPDNLPFKPYIRESLRLRAAYMMRQEDGRNTNGPTKASAVEQYAQVMYHDGVAAWQFHYDFHRTGRAYLTTEGADGPWIDFEKPGRNTHVLADRSVLPLRSLIPIEMDGLLGAQKNLGYSSSVSAAIRLHDQCIHVGQVAGATAAICLQQNLRARAIPFDRRSLERLRHALCGGTPTATPMLLWPFRDLPADHSAFVAVNRLAARRALPLARDEVDFLPGCRRVAIGAEDVVTQTAEMLETTALPVAPTGEMTRGEFARSWWELIADLPERPYHRASANDADDDGIGDREDALPLDPAADSWSTESVGPRPR